MPSMVTPIIVPTVLVPAIHFNEEQGIAYLVGMVIGLIMVPLILEVCDRAGRWKAEREQQKQMA